MPGQTLRPVFSPRRSLRSLRRDSTKFLRSGTRASSSQHRAMKVSILRYTSALYSALLVLVQTLLKWRLDITPAGGDTERAAVLPNFHSRDQLLTCTFDIHTAN